MLSRERKAELVKLAIASTEAAQENGLTDYELSEITAAAIEAMPEEGCGEAEAMEAECNCPDNGRDGHHPLCIVGPKPGSNEEWREAVDRATAAIIQCKRDRHAPITGDERWEAKAALSARPPVTASDALPAPPSPRS